MRRLRAEMDAANVLVTVGAAVAALGLGLMWLPLAPLFVGLLLLTLGLLAGRPRVR